MASTEEADGAHHFSQALKFYQAGETAEAIVALNKATLDRRFSLADYARFEAANLYFQQQQYQAAAEAYRSISANYPQSILQARANLLEAKSEYVLKNYRQAIRTVQRLLDNYPEAKEAAEARYLSAAGYLALKDWREAYQAYADTDLYYPLTTFGKQSRLAMRQLEKKYRKSLPRLKVTAQALFKKGMLYFEQADFDLAANIFSRLAREFPKSKYVSEAWLMLGRAEMQTSRYPFAISDLARATVGEPSVAARAYYYLGLSYGQRGDYDTGIYNLKKVVDNYPEANVAPEAAYWIGYYYELKADLNTALLEYYNLLNKFPLSSSVSAAIWRMGRIYYWHQDYKNAVVYWHLAQLYPAGEETPRCYFFEAKALEKLNKKKEADEVFNSLIARFDHTYYAYRARELTNLPADKPVPFNGGDFSEALNNLEKNDRERLAAIMEIWEQTKGDDRQLAAEGEVSVHLQKYKDLMAMGLNNFAAEEARYLVNLTSEQERDSAQVKLGEMLANSGSYRAPINYAAKKIKTAVMAGQPELISRTVWRLGYPRGYWKTVVKNAARYKLDPYLLLAVIREESRFNPVAVSRSRAQGLMQIMPATGKGLARSLKLKNYRLSKLQQPEVNIQMGAYFLQDLIADFNGNVYLALASYNGGPNRIKRYVKEWHNGDLANIDIDEFIESIPIRETRLYVQKVMGSYFEYKRLYD